MNNIEALQHYLQDMPETRFTLIVVEDDQGLNRLIQKRLQRQSFNVAGAYTGAEGIQLARTLPDALLLIDYTLPDMTGKEIVLTLNRDKHITPFIVITGQGDERTAVEMMKLGARDYLVKDANFLDLLPSVVQQITEQLDTERRLQQAESALRESEYRFSLLFQNAAVGISLATLDGRPLAANEATLRMSGYEPEELSQINLTDTYTNPDDRVRIIDMLRRDGRVNNQEVRLKRKDGTLYWVNMTLDTLTFEGQEAMLVTFEDITERKRSQERVSYLNAVLRGIRRVNHLITQESDRDRLIQGACNSLIEPFGYANAWIARMDHAGQIITVASAGFNGAFVRLDQRIRQGASPTCVRQTLDDTGVVVIHDPSVDCPDCSIVSACRREARLSIRLAHGDRIYGVIAVAVDASFVDDAEVQRLFAETARDLASALYKIDLEEERQRTENELRTSQERLITAMRAGKLAWWEMDVANGIMVSDDQKALMLGFEPDHFVGAHHSAFTDLLHPDDCERTLQAMRDYLHGVADSYDAEYRIKTQSGAWRWFHDYGQITQRDADGRPLRITGVVVDVTDRQETALALQRTLDKLEERVAERTRALSDANAELARAARVKDEFLANMSHELRTPLSAVLGMTEVLRDGIYGPLNERQNTALQSIDESGQHLLELITDILDVAKIDAGRTVLDFAAVNVQEVVNASFHLVIQQARKKQLHLHCECDPAITALYADARRLKQILVNLLSNAVKFTPTEGQIGLEVTGDVEHSAVRFSVWDTGIGIAPDHLQHLFQPFYQVDSGLARSYEGTGLGLSLVVRLAEMHGGSVDVESQVGAGSRFTVILPWRKPMTNSESPSHIADTDTVAETITNVANHPLVLVAEDNEAASTLICDYLNSRGFRIVTSRNGEDALRLAAKMHPALIVMDIQMPRINGLEATRLIRADANMADIPIIALSALAIPGDRERCLEAGANDYIAKPVSLKRLMQSITGLLQPITTERPQVQ